jgi:predicted signal transduction protein with EAL and GGDEF domain
MGDRCDIAAANDITASKKDAVVCLFVSAGRNMCVSQASNVKLLKFTLQSVLLVCSRRDFTSGLNSDRRP